MYCSVLYCVVIVSTLITLAQEDSGPEASTPVQVVVTDDVANPLIGFDSSSLEAAINDGNDRKLIKIIFLFLVMIIYMEKYSFELIFLLKTIHELHHLLYRYNGR